jgi:hypothetical protein
MIRCEQDKRVNFPAYHVSMATKTDLRRFVAEHGLLWISHQFQKGVKGCVVADIDDTLINGNEQVSNGFEHMLDMYKKVSLMYPVHIVTARPDEEHANVMALLSKKGFHVDPDRLHMLPTHLYYRPVEEGHVERFKWAKHGEICKIHGFVIARFGDKMWDVACLNSIVPGGERYREVKTTPGIARSTKQPYLEHVPDSWCYIYFDPALRGTLSSKLPGR